MWNSFLLKSDLKCLWSPCQTNTNWREERDPPLSLFSISASNVFLFFVLRPRSLFAMRHAFLNTCTCILYILQHNNLEEKYTFYVNFLLGLETIKCHDFRRVEESEICHILVNGNLHCNTKIAISNSFCWSGRKGLCLGDTKECFSIRRAHVCDIAPKVSKAIQCL